MRLAIFVNKADHFTQSTSKKDSIRHEIDDNFFFLSITDCASTDKNYAFFIKAFSKVSYNVRREMCAYMVFAVVEKAGSEVMIDGEEVRLNLI